ncbi:MAG TPA: hypothetical protein PKM73_04945 [Verrucomicrobiota bacterium]|nr:hypothetical protein [Verrucomicrobiota bacterium]HNU50709.1 hypothetical protein [Verrucomicrobiota bacterium]
MQPTLNNGTTKDVSFPTPIKHPSGAVLEGIPLLFLLTLTAALLIPRLRAEEGKRWTVDATLYGLAAGLSGDVTIKGFDAPLDVGFDQIWDNLELGAMGKVRVGYDRWALTTDVIYMGLQASQGPLTAALDQWVVEPSLSYRVCKGFELLAGARYYNLSGELRGPGLLPAPRMLAGTQDWWDPIVGANVTLPLGRRFSFNLRGDVGGFGAGSDLTWQAFPWFGWHISKSFSLQAGYRWVYTDYETGSGPSRFRYDVLTQGPQVGFALSF